MVRVLSGDSHVSARVFQFVDQLEAFTLPLVLELSPVVGVVRIVGRVVDGALKEVVLVESAVVWDLSSCSHGGSSLQ